MKTLDLIALAENCPGTTISVKLSDLLEAGRSFKAELLQDLCENQKTAQNPDEFITREQAMKKIKVSSATLWRWKKCGYLVPVRIGAFDRYRLSDINALIDKK